ncbi:hypothetical protein HPB48_005209 [Haemaphysalis longicornis]|uniref:SCP domain-containing protein n=1 Tax=Haemaphysalis longicornis TaxID=44386 RepID=A0A9J6F7B2_HAELO|nr:hypothetical protein HPB48_005209 [Haemaphysalis longicornis]
MNLKSLVIQQVKKLFLSSLFVFLPNFLRFPAVQGKSAVLSFFLLAAPSLVSGFHLYEVSPGIGAGEEAFVHMGLRAAVWLVASLVACCPGSGLARTCRAAYRNTVNGVVHTACQPQNRNCTILRRGLSAADKKALLRRHNKLRSLVATGRLKGYKPAANMYELVWDDELAEVAQALADRCGDMSHDLASARFTRRFKLTGQNLATEQRSNQVMTVNWVRFIDRWFKEHKNYPPQQVKRFQPSFEGRPVGHFTQLVPRQLLS